MSGPILAQGHQGSIGQGDEAVFAAFAAANVHPPSLGINVCDGEVKGFTQPEPHGVDGKDKNTIANLLGGISDP